MIADPGTWSIADGFRRALAQIFGSEAHAVRDLGALDQAILDKAEAFIRKDPMLAWKVIQRGFWVHGVDTLRALFAEAERYRMRGHAEKISCPTLITRADGDTLAADAEMLFDTLRCPKALMTFTAAEGTGGQCEMGNRSLLNCRVLDWLDEEFA